MDDTTTARQKYNVWKNKLSEMCLELIEDENFMLTGEDLADAVESLYTLSTFLPAVREFS